MLDSRKNVNTKLKFKEFSRSNDKNLSFLRISRQRQQSGSSVSAKVWFSQFVKSKSSRRMCNFLFQFYKKVNPTRLKMIRGTSLPLLPSNFAIDSLFLFAILIETSSILVVENKESQC
jgi:hypothetical protein